LPAKDTVRRQVGGTAVRIGVLGARAMHALLCQGNTPLAHASNI
jgi:hypothetical protein